MERRRYGETEGRSEIRSKVGVVTRGLFGVALLAGFCFGLIARGQETAPAPAAQTGARFAHVEVFVDSGDVPLAAYQIELEATRGDVRIVGVEGGESAAFAEPPYYDPAAMQHDRVILAAFNTGDELPTGKTRLARVHVMITGAAEPEYATQLVVAASSDGKEIDHASLTLAEGEA